MRTRPLFAVVLLLALLAGLPASSAAQEDARFGVTLFTGLQNTPTAFDVVRSVEYDGGVRLGAGLLLRFDEYVSVRGTFAMSQNSGRETGVVNDEVDFTRQYFGADLQVSYPLSPALSPYVFAGGGMVRIDRSAPSYAYDMTEGAALFGLGARYAVGESLSLFVEGQGWVYSRQTVGETQVDRSVNVGISYQIP